MYMKMNPIFVMTSSKNSKFFNSSCGAGVGESDVNQAAQVRIPQAPEDGDGGEKKLTPAIMLVVHFDLF